MSRDPSALNVIGVAATRLSATPGAGSEWSSAPVVTSQTFTWAVMSASWAVPVLTTPASLSLIHI